MSLSPVRLDLLVWPHTSALSGSRAAGSHHIHKRTRSFGLGLGLGLGLSVRIRVRRGRVDWKPLSIIVRLLQVMYPPFSRLMGLYPVEMDDGRRKVKVKVRV